MKLNLTVIGLVSVALVQSGPAMAADPAAGAKVFKAQCAVCHTTAANGPAGVGPRLNGVVGRRAGSLPGFAYSPAMKKFGITWSGADLERYIADPAHVVQGNRMPYAGLKNAQQRADLIAYLQSLH